MVGGIIADLTCCIKMPAVDMEAERHRKIDALHVLSQTSLEPHHQDMVIHLKAAIASDPPLKKISENQQCRYQNVNKTVAP